MNDEDVEWLHRHSSFWSDADAEWFCERVAIKIYEAGMTEVLARYTALLDLKRGRVGHER